LKAEVSKIQLCLSHVRFLSVATVCTRNSVSARAPTHHRLLAGVKLTLSSLIDGKNFNAGGHKLGLGVEFEV